MNLLIVYVVFDKYSEKRNMISIFNYQTGF